MCPPITWTDKSEEHIARHNVQPYEVEDVLYSKPRLKIRGEGDTMKYFGQTDAGRYLAVLTAPANDGGTYIVTARDMDEAEKKRFQRRFQTKGR